jgi:hypothetical protein
VRLSPTGLSSWATLGQRISMPSTPAISDGMNIAIFRRAEIGNDLVRGVTIRAGVAAVLDQGHLGPGDSRVHDRAGSTGRSSLLGRAEAMRDARHYR